MDLEGAVVNGDCYWFTSDQGLEGDLLWLALAVANSTFIETFYDHKFHNKLYSGRRRFMTQYVEQFPIPDPKSPLSRRIIHTAKAIYDLVPSVRAQELEQALDTFVSEAFGVDPKKLCRQA
jgi:hypothetical protein